HLDELHMVLLLEISVLHTPLGEAESNGIGHHIERSTSIVSVNLATYTLIIFRVFTEIECDKLLYGVSSDIPVSPICTHGVRPSFKFIMVCNRRTKFVKVFVMVSIAYTCSTELSTCDNRMT